MPGGHYSVPQDISTLQSGGKFKGTHSIKGVKIHKKALYFVRDTINVNLLAGYKVFLKFDCDEKGFAVHCTYFRSQGQGHGQDHPI